MTPATLMDVVRTRMIASIQPARIILIPLAFLQ
jgi:hypothetical protein